MLGKTHGKESAEQEYIRELQKLNQEAAARNEKNEKLDVKPDFSIETLLKS